MELSQVLQALRNADAAGDTEAAKRLAQIARQMTGGVAAPPETTFLGQAKEAFKGLIPGAVGLVEQAAIGASALLPEEQERAAREAIASTAGALKAPFAPAPGYEETVGRKLGEAVGSTGPFLLAGPLGLAGRLGAVGLGVGAGAGEARTRAEAEGATAEQRGTATALGTLPGALEVFAPFRILSRIPEGEVLDAAARVRRVLAAAGEEAAQEAASSLAQNMIARGVYKPEQELIEGLGEQAAYGGATGAIVQGLMDLALGRRARGAGTAPETEAPIDRLKREAAEKAQAEERARAEPVNRAQTVIDETAGLPIGEAFPRLTREIEVLRQQPKSPERDEAIKALTEERRRRQTEDAGQLIEGRRAAQGFMTAEEAEAAGVVPRSELDLAQAEIEDLTRRRDALLVKGKPPAPKSPARREFDRIEARLGELGGTAPTAATAPTGAEAVPEPTVRVEQGPKPLSEVLDSETIKAIGFTRGKIHDALVGKSITDPEIRAVLEEYKQGKNVSKKTVDKIDAFLGRLPETVPAAEAAAPPTAPSVPETPAVEAAPPVPEAPVPPPVTPEVPTRILSAKDFKDPRDFSKYVKSLPANALNGSDITASGWLGEDISGTVESEEDGALVVRRYDGTRTIAEKTQVTDIAPTTPETPSATRTEPETGGAGAPVAGGPTAVSAPGGAGVVEPTGVVPPAEDAGQPPAGEGEQPGAVAEAPAAPAPAPKPPRTRKAAEPAEPIARGEYEPPVKEGLKPERERQLRAKLGQQLKEIEVLTAARDKAEGNLYLAEITGNEEAKARAIDAFEGARLVLKKAVSSADRTYGQLFDLEKADFEGSVGEAYVAELRAEREARDKAARAPELAGSYPYNLKTAEAVQEELRDQASHLPGYKELIEKYFTPSRQLRKGKTEEEFVREGQEFLRKETLYQRSRLISTDLNNSKEMDDALRGKSFTEAVDYAIKNARDDADRAIMVKAKRRAQELIQNGVEFSFKLTAPGRMLVGKLGVTQTTFSGLGESTKVDVALNGYTGDEDTTLSQETLAHEIVHAVTTAQIRFAPQGSAALKLKALQQEVVGEYNNRFKAGALTAEEKDMGPLALESPSELLAYGLTNRKVQNWLASFKDPTGKTYISRLFNIVSQVLGLKGKENTALARLMSISEEMLDESLTPYIAEANRIGASFGRQENLTDFPSWLLKESVGFKPAWFKGDIGLVEGQSTLGKTIYVPARKNVGRGSVDVRNYSGPGFTPAELAELRKAATDLEAGRGTITNAARAVARKELVGKKEEGTLGDYLGRTFGARKTIGLRALMMDSLASVEAKLGEAYGEKIRDMMGNMNPVVLLSRALDSVRFAAEMLSVGKMVVDPSGMTRLTTLSHNGQNISYAGVMRDIKAEAERRGMTGEAFVKEIGEVLAGRREYELMRTPDAASLEFFLTPQEAQAANNRFNNDAFIKDVSEKLDAIRFAGIDFLVATGRIPESKAQEWKDATGYIPFKRIDEMDKLYADRGGGIPSDLKLAAFKGMGKFTGSDERQTENPLENFVGLMEWMTREGMKAEAVGRALNDMVLIGAAKRVPTAQAVADNQKGAVVSSWENGKQKFYLVPDPADFAAFAGFKASTVAGPVKAMQQVSKVLRIGVTATPAFAIKQVFDDITRAYVHSGVKNPAALIPRMMLEMPKAWWAEVRGLRTPGMEMLARHGVVPTYDTIEGGNVRNIFEETGISKRSMSKAIMRIIEAGAKASDIATRQAIFDQTMKETGDVDLAEQRAREIINFSRKGASSTADFFIRTVPFFNAYARSMDKLLLAAAGNPAMQKTLGMSTGYARNLFFKRMIVLTVAGLGYAMLMSDDEDYQDLSDNVRDRNWVLPYGKELGFTPVIPLPAELAFFFKAIPERVVQYYKLQGTPEERDALRVAKEMLLAGVDLFSTPNLTPQLVKPFYENLVNYSFFLGRPLESQAQLALDPSKRYGTSTSEAIKAGTAALSEAGIEISPIMVENAVRGVLGMSAGLAISVADALVNPTRTDRPLHQQIIPQLTGASALMKDPVGNRFLDDIYDLDKKVEQAYNTYKKEEKDDPEKANEYYLKTFGLQSIREEMKDVMKVIREMNAQARAIDKMTDIPSEERAQLIADLKSQQNELARISYALRRRAALAQMEAEG